MLFLKILYWVIFIIALLMFFYFHEETLAFFLMVTDLTLMALPKD